MVIKTLDEARSLARLDAVARAKTYLEREAPNTLGPISFWVNDKGWDYGAVFAEFEQIYGITEEKTQHKIRLVIEDMIRERDDDPN